MLALKFPTPGFQKSSANTTVEAAVRVKPGSREANKCSIVSCSKGCVYMPICMFVLRACMSDECDHSNVCMYVPALAVVIESTATKHCSSCWNLSQ